MISEYINYISNLRGLSETTSREYEKDLRTFANWAAQNKTDARWSTITRDDIDRYISQQAASGLAPATTNRRLSSISGLYSYMMRQGWLDFNPCKYESRRKVARTMPNVIDVEELKTAYKHAAGITKVILGILMTTGIRIQELLDLKWSDLEPATKQIRVHGKGNKERMAFLPDEVWNTLQPYVNSTHPQELIFGIDQRTARKLVYDNLRRYCSAKQLSPHAIRHTFATNLARGGVSSAAISGLLGHADLKSAERYINRAQLEYEQISNKHSLLN